jgi:hypothetical protein
MPHDDLFDHGTPTEGFAGHTHEENAGVPHTEGLSALPTVGGAGFVPMAEPLAIDTGGGSPGGTVALTPNPEGPGTFPGIPGIPGTIPQLPQLPQLPGPQLQFPKFCNLSLPGGCYRLSFRPQKSFIEYRGTLRVDRTSATPIVSGDLYRFLLLPPFVTESIATTASTRALGNGDDPTPGASPAVGSLSEAKLAGLSLFTRSLGIPIYPRNKYHSYLKGTALSVPVFSFGACAITITMQEYFYTQPPVGQFNGTFPASPGSRTVKLVLTPAPAPLGYPSVYFEGRLYENNVDKGRVTLGWVSKYFRRATIEVDTVVGAVAPQAVGAESLRSIYGKAGWNVGVTYDQTNIPIPAGVNANACWSSADLHALMMSVRNPATNLDTDWHMHLVVVPATMGCGRGVMYDTIQVHETGHGFNQIHQEQEGGADNSIMTTTPSVANVLGGPTTGEPGIFPDNINLAFNEHVRHHLVHFPDIAVRPGGMTFGSGHSSTLPQADRTYFAPSELELTLDVESSHIELGEPLQLSWTLTNRTDETLPVPNDLGIEAQHTFIDVIDANGLTRNMPSFVIRTDQASMMALEPGESITGSTRLFWSSNGFAFDKPGHFAVEVRVIWSIAGIPVGVKAAKHVWVNFPQTQLDNDAAAQLLHPEVGKYVALGGGANHLTEAVARLSRVMGVAEEGDERGLRTTATVTAERPKALRGFKGVHLPRPRGQERTRAVRAPDEIPISVTRDVEKGNPGRSSSASGRSKAGRARSR